MPTCFTPASPASLTALLAQVSTASKPNAFATPVPAAPPIAFDNGAITPFMEPVIMSYPKSVNLYSLPEITLSLALIAVFTAAPAPAATRREAPPVTGANAAAPTAAIPEMISPTTSTHIFCPSL